MCIEVGHNSKFLFVFDLNVVIFCCFFSSFDMDEFKRTYSNKDTETVAIPHFWEHFNKEDFSVWLAEYQYNEDLKRVFMACNLVGGMFQRLDKLHKTAFASVCVFGKDGDVSISGIWICRTQELAFSVGVKNSWQDNFFLLSR